MVYKCASSIPRCQICRPINLMQSQMKCTLSCKVYIYVTAQRPKLCALVTTSRVPLEAWAHADHKATGITSSLDLSMHCNPFSHTVHSDLKWFRRVTKQVLGTEKPTQKITMPVDVMTCNP